MLNTQNNCIFIYSLTWGGVRLYVTFPDRMDAETTSEYRNVMRECVTVLIDLKGLMKGCGLKVMESYIDVAIWMDISFFGK